MHAPAAAAALHHTYTQTHTMKHFRLPLTLFSTHSRTHTQTHLHFPADPVTVDVITAFNLRGIRLPLTDLTAFTTQAGRRL